MRSSRRSGQKSGRLGWSRKAGPKAGRGRNDGPKIGRLRDARQRNGLRGNTGKTWRAAESICGSICSSRSERKSIAS